MRTMRSLFSVQGYLSFFASRLFNSIAIWIDFTLIFSVLSFNYNAAPRTLGIAAALYGLPGLLLGPFIGVLADRNSPALVMLASSTGRLITSLLLAIAPNESFFITMVLLKGVSNLGGVPAEQILVRRLLTDEQIVSTTTLTSLVDQCTKIASPLLGAALAVVSHSRGGFLFTAVLACASVGCTVRIGSTIGWKSADHEARNRLPNFPVLWETILGKPRFTVTLTLMLALSLTLGLYDSILVLLLREHGLPASAFGTIVSCTAAGAIACALVLKRMLVRTNEFRVMLVFLCGFSMTVIAAGILGISYERLSLPVLCVLWLLNGFCYAGGVMAYSISLQTESPREMLGVLSSTVRSLQLCALVGGPIVGSWIAQHFGTPWAFIGAGAVGLCIACVGASVFPLRILQPEG
ncbi:MFS transporter [Trinickia violacea]|nr:MFS transporter [Trinickia violacea]